MSPTAPPTRPCPRRSRPDQLTLEEAAQLIDERAAKGPPAKKGRGRKPAAKKTPASKAPAKKAPAKKAAPKKKG